MRIRTLIISLLAVFAFSAIASASASAFALEWQTCQEKAGGKFENHGCAKEGPPKTFEWETLGAGVTKKIISTKLAGSAEFVLNAGGKEIKCKKVDDTGTITGGKPGTDEATEIKFTECKTTEANCKVKSAKGKAPAGTILVTSIKTKLVEGETSGGAKVVADEFKGNGAEEEFVKLEFGETEKVVGVPPNDVHTLETACAGGKYPSPTTVKGKVYAISQEVGLPLIGLLKFPAGGLKTPKNTLEAFAISAKLTGEEEQTLENGWAIREI